MTVELCRMESCVPGRVTLYMYALQIGRNRPDGV